MINDELCQLSRLARASLTSDECKLVRLDNFDYLFSELVNGQLLALLFNVHYFLIN